MTERASVGAAATGILAQPAQGGFARVQVGRRASFQRYLCANRVMYRN